jgi:hypothetical protein
MLSKFSLSFKSERAYLWIARFAKDFTKAANSYLSSSSDLYTPESTPRSSPSSEFIGLPKIISLVIYLGSKVLHRLK